MREDVLCVYNIYTTASKQPGAVDSYNCLTKSGLVCAMFVGCSVHGSSVYGGVFSRSESICQVHCI